MAETTRRRTGELLRKLFDILKQSPEGMSAASALEQLAASVQLTEYEAGNYASGSRRFEKIVRFATVDCVKAGWLVKHKGDLDGHRGRTGSAQEVHRSGSLPQRGGASLLRLEEGARSLRGGDHQSARRARGR